MISTLQHNHRTIAQQIHVIFQASYAVEAELLGATHFPPLNRPVESYVQSNNSFYGYTERGQLAGVIEVELCNEYVDINSLVVEPKFFRLGIASKLLAFTFEKFDTHRFVVETGLDNIPAIRLYKKHEFVEIKQWDTHFGIRKVQFERIKRK